jgi:hydroxyethylthiazole kinase-like uncharacterized protein yjeF
MNTLFADPILSCEESLVFEKSFFEGDEEREWKAMNQAGESLGDSFLRDMRELRTIPHHPRILVLVGKGHNGGDALIAVKRMLRTIPTARAVVWPLCQWDECRPLTQRARSEMMELASKRIEEMSPASELGGIDGLKNALAEQTEDRGFDASIDGLLGMQASLPLRSPLADWVKLLNEFDEIAVRAAVDLPTGIGEGSGEAALRADFTYCTGIVKSPVVSPDNLRWTGRLRYLDLGFFDRGSEEPQDDRACVLRSSSLRMLRKLRPVACDKRDQGHLFLLAGSRELGGAALMAAQAALKAGVGLLTVGIPESLHPAFVARRPEAMWVPLPETPDGGLALEGLGKVRQFLPKATALAIGPGLGQEGESHTLVREALSFFDGPVVLDADALRPEILKDVKNPDRLVLTPHAGEFARIADSRAPEEYASETGSVLVFKGSHTRIVSPRSNHYSMLGSSVLARGGSGDLLTGILGAILAKETFDLSTSAALAVLWHGRAAEVLARQHGQEAVYATDLLGYLSFAIRNDF